MTSRSRSTVDVMAPLREIPKIPTIRKAFLFRSCDVARDCSIRATRRDCRYLMSTDKKRRINGLLKKNGEELKTVSKIAPALGAWLEEANTGKMYWMTARYFGAGGKAL